MKNNIDEVIKECLNNPVVRFICMKEKDMTYAQDEKKRKEFSRALGFCILFKSTEDIEQYMMIDEEEEQIKFLKRKILKALGFSEDELESRKKDIIQYAVENFKINGYVFHGANSASIEKKMTDGLNGNGSSLEQKKELLRISTIYKKYGNDNPLGWGTLDIQYKRDGWFYDGHPQNIQYYANSPEWFNQFCGESSYYAYGTVPDECRHGYANRDYKTCLEAITALIDKNQMTETDRNEIISFFNNCWNKFGNTTPCLLLIPVTAIHSQRALDFTREYFLSGSDSSQRRLFSDIISGSVTDDNNICCKKSISPENLRSVDLSPILPRFKIKRTQESELTLEECIRMLKGFDLQALKTAQELLNSLVTKSEKREEH